MRLIISFAIGTARLLFRSKPQNNRVLKCHDPCDIFAADVYILGKTRILQYELNAAFGSSSSALIVS